MNLEQLVPVLQLSVGPVIVISGVGLIVLSMTNRYGRVIDRSRTLAHEIRSQMNYDVNQARLQLQILLRRARVLRMAIALASMSLLLAATLVIVLFMSELMGFNNAAPIIVLFIACMVSLVFGLIAFLIDINMSLSALTLEVDVDQYHRPADARPGEPRGG